MSGGLLLKRCRGWKGLGFWMAFGVGFLGHFWVGCLAKSGGIVLHFWFMLWGIPSVGCLVL